MKQTFFVSSLMVVLILIASSNFVLADTYVNDPNNCPTSFQSQTCAVSGQVMCGFNNNILFCSDPSSLSAPTGNTTSTTNVSSSFGGGYIFDCESHDGTAPFCDSGGSYECDRNETTHSTNNRVTICVGTSSTSITGGFGISTPGDCRSGYFTCSGTSSITSVASLGASATCNFQENSSCGSGTGVIDSSSGSQCLNSSTANCVSNNTLDCNDDDGDGNIQTCNGANGCEISEGGSCGSGTGTYAADTCQNNTGHCTSSTNLDCDNDDSDGTTSTCNGANGCEITPGSSCTTSSGLSGTYASTCSSGAGVCVPSASDFNTGTETGFSSDSGTPLLWGVQYGLGALLNFTNSVTQNFFVVTNNGTVGIGMNNTSVPASMLHVNSSSANTKPIITVENQAGDFQMFRTDATPESSVTGSVGDIAVDSTGGKMYIKETGSSTNTGWTELGGSATSTSDDDGDTSIQVEESSDEDVIRFDTAGTERMVIDNTGRIGIGTGSPNQNFTMVGGNFLLNSTGNPIHVGSITNSDSGTALDGAFGLYIHGKHAYVASETSAAIQIIDISDPANPTATGSLSDTACEATSGGVSCELDGARAIYVSGKHAYTVTRNGDGFGIFDVSDPSSPTFVSSVDNADCGAEVGGNGCELDGALNLYLSGKYLYVTGPGDDGVEILDVSDPTNPTHVGSITDDSTTELDQAIDIYVSGKYAYVTAASDDGVEILDVSDPTNPTHVGAIDNAVCDAAVGGIGCQLNSADSIYVSGKYAYVTSTGVDDGVSIIDVSNPASPVHVGAITDTVCDAAVGGDGCALQQPKKIVVSGKYLYVTDLHDDGLEILDISGIDVPAASIGNIATNNISVTENAVIANNLYSSGLNVGIHGINSDGSISTTGNFTASMINGTMLEIAHTDNFLAANVTNTGTADSFRVNDQSSDTTPFVIDSSGNVFVGGTSETLDNSGFTQDGDDVFVAGTVGVEGNIYTDGSLVSGASLTLSDSGITDSNSDLAFTSTTDGFTFTFTDGGTGDDFIVDTDVLVVESDNNRVGVGTTSPAAPLSVYTGNAAEQAQFGRSSGEHLSIEVQDAHMYLDYEQDEDGNGPHYFYIRNNAAGTGNNEIRFQTSSADRLIISDDGNVGIGSSVPSALFQVQGSVGNVQVPDNGARLQFSRDSANYIQATNSGGDFVFLVNGDADSNPSMTIDSNRRVGIGLHNAADVLEVRTGTTNNDMDVVFSETGTDQQKIIFEEDNVDFFAIYHDGEAANPGNLLTFQAADGNDGTLDVDVMTFAQSGNVGIGETAPVHQLHVEGTSPTLMLEGPSTVSNPVNSGSILFSEGNDSIQFTISHDGSSNILKFNSSAVDNVLAIARDSGNVGIGVSDPDSPLEIQPSSTATEANMLKLTGGQDGRSMSILQPQQADSEDPFTFFTNNAFTFRVDGFDVLNLDAFGNIGLNDCLAPDHDLVIGGTGTGCNTGTYSEIDAGEASFSTSSSRTIKENITPVNVDNILDLMANVTVNTYDFKPEYCSSGDYESCHDKMGLVAEDFYTIFKRGSDKSISGQEMQMAVWLASQELARQNESQQQEIEEQQQKIEEQQQDIDLLKLYIEQLKEITCNDNPDSEFCGDE